MSPKGWYDVKDWAISKGAVIRTDKPTIIGHNRGEVNPDWLGIYYQMASRRLADLNLAMARQPVNADGTVTFPIYKEENDVNEEPQLVSVQVIEARDGAAAKVTAHVAGGRYVATGASKRNKGEPFVADVGGRLALSRAFENLAREMRKGIK